MSPVFLDPVKHVPADDSVSVVEVLGSLVASRRAGFDKLMALGLTEDEAKAIAGI